MAQYFIHFQMKKNTIRKHPAACPYIDMLTRDVTKFEFERWRISYNFTAFDIRRMLKLPSRRMRIRFLFTFHKCKQRWQLTLTVPEIYPCITKNIDCD